MSSLHHQHRQRRQLSFSPRPTPWGEENNVQHSSDDITKSPPPKAVGVLSNSTSAASVAAHQQTPKPTLVSLANNEKTPAYLKSPISKSFGRLLGASKVLSPLPMITSSSKKKAEDTSMNKADKENGGKRKLKQRASDSNLMNPIMGANLLDNKNDDHGDDDDDDDGARNPFDEILRDPDLYRALVLVMALDREPKGNTDANNTSTEPPQTVIKEGFYWKDFPSLERLLFDSMEQYYKLSTNKRQSKQQQAFNNALVESIRSTAIDSGYSFDNYFESDDKRLRDRIRCFFKTHLQNAKKRLVTLQKKPDSFENQKILRGFLKKAKQGLKEAALEREDELFLEEDSPRPQKRRRSL